MVLSWAGYEWKLKDSRGRDRYGPGHNWWNEKNVNADDGRLHLSIAYDEQLERWSCAQVIATQEFHFGVYNFVLEGPVHNLDRNVVVGMFCYAVPGCRFYDEIDIEIHRFLRAGGYPQNLFYHVYPAHVNEETCGLLGGRNHAQLPPVTLSVPDVTTHRFTWTPDSVLFEGLHGHREIGSNQALFASRRFGPTRPEKWIPQRACLTPRINVWLRHGEAPSDDQQVEVIVRDFSYQAL